MEINFDGLRKRLIADYNSLVDKLNSKTSGDNVKIDTYYIQRELDGLRSALVALAFTYQKGEDGFNCLDDNTHFESFNPEPEE